MDTDSGDGAQSTPFFSMINDPVDPSALDPGMVFGDWTLVQPLGAGGMGAVWLVRKGEQSGALKVGFQREPASTERFYRERALLWSLRSPRVVRLLDWGDAPMPWYVMESVPGLSLEQHLQTGPFSPEHARWVLEELAGAVTDLHRLRLAHRDLKPANVMVSSVVKVIDLGLGLHETDPRLTSTGFCSGSLGYLPPEAMDGVFDPFRADLYALGILLSEMLVGRWVFGSARKLARWQLSGVPLRLTTGPQWLRDLACDLTHPEQRRRISKMEEVNERLLWAENRRAQSRRFCLIGPSEASRVLAWLEAA